MTCALVNPLTWAVVNALITEVVNCATSTVLNAEICAELKPCTMLVDKLAACVVVKAFNWAEVNAPTKVVPNVLS